MGLSESVDFHPVAFTIARGVENKAETLGGGATWLGEFAVLGFGFHLPFARELVGKAGRDQVSEAERLGKVAQRLLDVDRRLPLWVFLSTVGDDRHIERVLGTVHCVVDVERLGNVGRESFGQIGDITPGAGEPCSGPKYTEARWMMQANVPGSGPSHREPSQHDSAGIDKGRGRH